jgi:ribonucleoside-diphosphate reductase alpha chain
MVEIVRQLTGIGGGRSSGVGPNRVRSLADGVGQVLREYLREDTTLSLETARKEGDSAKGNGNGNGKHAGGGFALALNLGGSSHEPESSKPESHPAMKIGDLCPECGEAALVNEEGCKKCYACGYSEC